jgi:hypothetical protein
LLDVPEGEWLCPLHQSEQQMVKFFKLDILLAFNLCLVFNWIEVYELSVIYGFIEYTVGKGWRSALYGAKRPPAGNGHDRLSRFKE